MRGERSESERSGRMKPHEGMNEEKEWVTGTGELDHAVNIRMSLVYLGSFCSFVHALHLIKLNKCVSEQQKETCPAQR